MPVGTTLPYTFKTAFDTSITRHLNNTEQYTINGKTYVSSHSTMVRDLDIEIYEQWFEEIKHLQHPVYLLVKPFAKKIHPELEIIHCENMWIMCFPKEYLKQEINVATMLKLSRWLKKYDAIQIK